MQCVYGDISHKPLEKKHHHHHHDEEHAHDHCHEHDYKSLDKKVLKISFLITIIAMAIEIIYGIISGSLALLSDAIHMFSHAFALALSFFAIVIAQKDVSLDKTFGYHRSEVLAAFINAITILLSIVFILYEAVVRFIYPEKIDIKSMIIVSIFGLIVNIITGFLLHKGDMENVNIKSSFAHMMSDLLSSVAIVIGAIVVYFTNWYFIDTLLAIFISIVIFKWGYSLVKDSVNVLLESSPVDVNKVKQEVMKVSLVKDIHDIHITEITHNMYVLTAHIVIDKNDVLKFKDIFSEISEILEHKFNIGHITLQPEW